MALRLYNTLTRKKEPFQPIDAGNVRMYVCGPTVYDFAHIGNARPVIVFDVLFRLLRQLYGADHVTYVRNITDVDDKINARAAQDYPDLPLNEAIRRVTEKTEKQFHDDVAALGCLPPTVEPRATEHIAAMKEMIDDLVANGCAYVAEDHVLFDVAAMPDYGKLSGRSLDEMIAGARVEVAPYKRDPMDFVLWKPSKPGEPSWPSPAGIAAPGRPGWHIECSAMSWKHLGKTFDIHGGGIDLVFPHHENEIAQSRCAFHTPVMANYWLHNGFLQVEGEKMAKSLGNFVTIHELLTGWKGYAWPGEGVCASTCSARTTGSRSTGRLKGSTCTRVALGVVWRSEGPFKEFLRARSRSCARCALRRSEHSEGASPRCMDLHSVGGPSRLRVLGANLYRNDIPGPKTRSARRL